MACISFQNSMAWSLTPVFLFLPLSGKSPGMSAHGAKYLWRPAFSLKSQKGQGSCGHVMEKIKR